MSRASAGAARLENATARATGGKRIKRRHYGEVAGDVSILVLEDGTRMSLECKFRAQSFVFVRKSIAQAAKYDRTAIPAAVLRVKGGRPLIALSLEAFTKIAGIRERDAAEQPTFTQPCAFCTALREVA